MQIKGWSGIVAIAVAVLAIIQEPAVIALIPEKYTQYIFLATTVIAALTRAVTIEKKPAPSDTPTPGSTNSEL